MILKEAKHNRCSECNSLKTYEPEVRGCDTCNSEITGDNLLTLTAFQNNDTTDDYLFCSWKCCFQKLAAIPCDRFMNLPFLHFDETSPTSARAFFEALEAK